MALALFIGTDVALLTAFIAGTAALGLIAGRVLKALREAYEARKLHYASEIETGGRVARVSAVAARP